MREFITAQKFEELARAGKLTDGELPAVRAGFSAEVKADEGKSRSLTFTISTANVDRQGDAVSVDGWELENFKLNPVVLWAHDYRVLPIGRATKIWKHAGKLKATAEFQDIDMPVIGPLAEAVYQSYKRGFMSAVSVGFLPRKWNWAEDEGRRFGIDFQEQELLEFSAVPVPANPEALIEARSAGIDVGPIKEWAKLTLKQLESDEEADQKHFVSWWVDFLKSPPVKGSPLEGSGNSGITDINKQLGEFRDELKTIREAIRLTNERLTNLR